MIREITVLILTYNEEPNIARTLDRLRWANRVLIVDSFSTDATATITRSFPNVDFHQHAFTTHSAQWNYALQLASTDWIVALDADHVLSEEFQNELRQLIPVAEVTGYSASFCYCIHGRRLRGTLYPSRIVLFRRSAGRFTQDGHTQQLQLKGAATSVLSASIDHDDRKPLSRWLQAQDAYARLEVHKLLNTTPDQLSAVDRLRKRIVFAPILVFFYTLFWKRLIFDGWPGWYYVFQRMTAELILSLHLLEEKLRK